jgi:hypothetical protein
MTAPNNSADTPNPYTQLAQIIHDLYWLAAEVCHGKPGCIERINATADPWDAAERLARSTSTAHGIPFVTFESVLTEAPPDLSKRPAGRRWPAGASMPLPWKSPRQLPHDHRGPGLRPLGG